MPPQADDVGPKLFRGELGRRPGEADKLRRRKELAGSPGEEREQFGLPTRQGQPLAGVIEYAPPNIEIEAGKLPPAPLPKIEPQLQAPQVALHPALIRVAGVRAVGLQVAALLPAKPAQGPVGEGDQLAVDRDPLPGIIEVPGVRDLALAQVELGQRLAGRIHAGHQVDTTLPRPKRTNEIGGVAWTEGAGGVGPTGVTLAGAGGSRLAANLPELSRRAVRCGRPRLVSRWHRGHQSHPGESARRLSGGDRRRPASRSAPPQPDGRD